MSFYDREYSHRVSYNTGVSPLIILIAISMILFVMLALFRAFTVVQYPQGSDINTVFTQNILNWFVLSSDPENLLARPWTVFSFAFIYVGVWALFSNLFWLWAFGHILTDMTGSRKLIPVFLYGTTAATIAFLMVYNLVPSFKENAGAGFLNGGGPAILAVAIATTALNPRHKLFPMLNGGISLWIVTLLYLIIVLATIPESNPAVYAAYIFAGITGYFFIFFQQRGYDTSAWMNKLYDWVTTLFEPKKADSNLTPIHKSTLFYNATKPPYRKTQNLTQQKLDEILDKMNKTGGYENLSEEEKDLLKRAGNEDVLDK